MKKTAWVLLMMLSAISWAINGNMGNGDGTESNPYLIEDLADFDTFANSANAATYWAAGVHTKLMTDIDLSGRTYTTAVIAPDTPFHGVFEGDSHTIINLVIDTQGANNNGLGLFGVIDGFDARVENTGILGCDIIGGNASQNIGGLCGTNRQGTIKNCHANIPFTSGDYSSSIGGLCGTNSYGIIMNSHATGSIIGGVIKSQKLGGLCGMNYGNIDSCYAMVSINAGYTLGGLCGENYSGLITNCYATGSVTGKNALGGLCGHSYYGKISNCYAEGQITGNLRWIGGLCGYSESGEISNCFAKGSVTGANNSENLGGLLGQKSGGSLNNCYSTGLVTSGNNSNALGGLCGRFSDSNINNSYSIGAVVSGDNSTNLGGFLGCLYSGIISNCYWDIESFGISDGVGNQTPDPVGLTGKTTTEMMSQSTFTSWDFSDSDGDAADWMMLREGEDYPRLAWQEVYGGDVAGLYGVDMIDIAYLARYWGLDDCNGADDCGRADIDNSGFVGIGDLAAVAEDWLNGI